MTGGAGSRHRLQRIAWIVVAASLAACATPGDELPDGSPDAVPPEASLPAKKPAKTPAYRPDRQPPAKLARIPPLEAPPARDPAEPEFEDLLERLRNNFALPQVEHATISQQADWFARHPAYLERVLNRASLYLPHVADEVAARGLPAELAFLPVIESAFDPFAYSHGRAAGLWQFIPGTGKRFGLKQNWWYDGRRDVVESTRAALEYLEYLHGLFDGDWLLAVAAYNCGEGTVGRAIRRNRAAGKPTDFWHLRLPAETRGYVPRLLGLAAVLADPAHYGLELPLLPDAATFTAVDLDGQIDLAVAAELAGIELDELQALNPGFNRWATDPDGPHRLQLPIAAAETFSVALAELPPGERVRWQRHQVRSGDTLGAIARRHRTTVEVLQSVNGLSGTQIRVGSHLMIPTSTRSVADYPLSADNRLASTQQRPRAGRVRSEHVVRNGDSLWSISRRHGVGVRELAAWNGMAPGDTLAVGRTLVVWRQGTAPAGAAAAGASRAPAAEPMLRRVNYTVRRGDSLYRIANSFRVSIDDIKRWNSLDGKRHLQPGQRLVLHVDVTAQSGG
jgi:membrane-bound lytic murein transglycosylase D